MLALALSLLQAIDDSDAAAPFGTFVTAVPHWGFIVIHSTLILVAVWLSRRVRATGNASAANGFLLFVVAYITYHAHLTHFLFAHTVSEVLDILTLVVIGTSLRRSKATAL